MDRSKTIMEEVVKSNPDVAKLALKYKLCYAFLPTLIYLYEDESKNKKVLIWLSSFTKKYTFETIKEGEWEWVEKRKFLIEDEQ